MAANLNVGFSGDLNGNLGDHGEELGDLDSSHRSKDVEKKRDSEKGCQMAIVRFLDGMCLSLLPSVLWLCYSALQNLIPSFPWIAPPCPPPWHNPRKGRDQILPSGNTDSEDTRVKWSHRWGFTLSALGYVVGFGNVLRFPYLAYTNGGGSFLIPYTVMLFLVGLPLFFLEVTIGQYSNKGPSKVFKRLAPAMKGIGFAMLFVSCIIAVYYNVLIAWAIRYLFAGMASNIPWFSKGYHVYGVEVGNKTIWDTCCLEIEKYNGSVSDWCNSTKENESHDEFTYHGHKHNCTFSTVEYFNKTIGLGDGSMNDSRFQGMNWELVSCLFASWVIVCACCILGVWSIGKVMYFTVPFPYAVLVIMFIWSVTLKGAGEGIKRYLTPNADMLLDPKTWSAAATQIFFSLSVGVGGLTSLGSHNDFDTNCHRTSMIVCLFNCLTSVFAGFVTFAVLGHMAHSTGLEFDRVLGDYKNGPELAFIAFPMALKFSEVPQLWSFLFFLMLITLGLSTAFVNIDTINTAIEENFDCVSRNNRDAFQ